MSISAQCSHCGRTYQLADRLEGKRVACKECGEHFIAEPSSATAVKEAPARPSRPSSARKSRDEDDDRRRRPRDEDDDEKPSRRSRSADDEDEDERDRPGGIPPMVWILGGAGALVLVLVVVLVAVFSGGGNPPPIAQNQPRPQFNNPPPIQPPIQNPPLIAPKPFVPGGKPFENPAPKPVAVLWKAKPDPAPTKVELAQTPKGSAQLLGTIQDIAPTTPSKYLLLKHGTFPKLGVQLFDLETMQSVASLPIEPSFIDDMRALSPDGRLWMRAGLNKGKGEPLQVIDLKANKIYPDFLPVGPLAGLSDFLSDTKAIAVSHNFQKVTVQIWNIETSAVETTFELQGKNWSSNVVALSPGRRYLAAYRPDDRKIHLYALANGELVGELEVKEEEKQFGNRYTAFGFAFSPDGEELAIAMKNFAKVRILSWKLAKGELAVEHDLAPTNEVFSRMTNVSKEGTALEWLPDRSGWLMAGKVILEHDSGRLAHEFSEDLQKNMRRRFLGRNHFAVITRGSPPRLDVMPVPGEVTASLEKSKKAGSASAALPAAKDIDLASAPRVSAAGQAWKVEPERPLDSAKTSATTLAPIAHAPLQVLDLDLTPGAAGQGLVLYAVSLDAVSTAQVVKAERIETETGRVLAKVDLFPTDKLPRRDPRGVGTFGGPNEAKIRGVISPDGSRAAIRFSATPQRIDVWDLQESKHLGGWKVSEADGINWAGFGSNDGLWIGTGSKLALIKIPDGKALAVVEGAQVGTSRFNFAGKTLTVATTGGLDFFDAATGQPRGRLDASAGFGSQGIGFGPDGREIAAANFNQIARWSLTSGKQLVVHTIKDATMSANLFSGGPKVGNTTFDAPTPRLRYLNSTQFLVGTDLVDVDSKMLVWSYALASHAPHQEPDQRAWGIISRGTSGAVIGLPLPDAAAIAFAKQLAKTPPQKVMQPGTKVQVQGGTEAARRNVENQIKQNGWVVGPGEVTVTLSTNETSKQEQYITGDPALGNLPGIIAGTIAKAGKGQTINVNFRTVKCIVTVTDKTGHVLGKSEQVVQTPDQIDFRGNNFQASLDERVNAGIDAALGVIPIQPNQYRIQGRIETLPMRSTPFRE